MQKLTRQRNDNHSTELGVWLRQQKEIDSSLGYVASNIDYIWSNYKTGEWMLIEEKRHMSDITYCQKNLFKKLRLAIQDKLFKGFHLVQFENTGPDDGKIYLNRKEITKESFIKFLQFKGAPYDAN